MPLFLIGTLLLVAPVLLIRRRVQRDWLWWLLLALPFIGGAMMAGSVALDFETQKFVSRLLMPLGLIWIGLSVILVLAWKRCRWRGRWALILLWTVYTLAGNSWFGTWLIGTLERQTPMIDFAVIEPLDAVCVLGGGTSRRLDKRPQIGAAGDRLLVGAQLYRLGKTPLLIASNPTSDTCLVWRNMGVPENVILALPLVVNTDQEIMACKKMKEQYGWKRFGLVTSAWHLPRALRLCRKYGLEVTPLPANYQSTPPQGFWLNFVPQEDAFYNVQHACWEYLGMIMGR